MTKQELTMGCLEEWLDRNHARLTRFSTGLVVIDSAMASVSSREGSFLDKVVDCMAKYEADIESFRRQPKLRLL